MFGIDNEALSNIQNAKIKLKFTKVGDIIMNDFEKAYCI